MKRIGCGLTLSLLALLGGGPAAFADDGQQQQEMDQQQQSQPADQQQSGSTDPQQQATSSPDPQQQATTSPDSQAAQQQQSQQDQQQPGQPKQLKPGQCEAMFDVGQFKCTDGYDPDTDASLHPKNQNPKVRMLVNAQAQFKHNKEVEKKNAAKPSDQDLDKNGNPPGSSKTDISDIKIDDAKTDEKKKDASKKDDKNKKSGDRKDGAKKDGSKKDGDKKDAEKKDEEKKSSVEEVTDAQARKEVEKARAEEKEKEGPVLDEKLASNPLHQALYAIQNRRYQRSVALLKEVISKFEDSAQAHYLLAVSYVGLRDYEDAKVQYGMVVKLAAKNPAANAKLSQLAEQGLKRITSSRK